LDGKPAVVVDDEHIGVTPDRMEGKHDRASAVHVLLSRQEDVVHDLCMRTRRRAADRQLVYLHEGKE
jgi:hypothetical protein